jgi:hypothetical protein
MRRPAARGGTHLDLFRPLLVTVALVTLQTAVAAAGPDNPDHPAGEAKLTPPILEATDIGGVDARTAALLLSGQQSGDVKGALAWTIGGTDDKGLLEVPFVAEVDGASLLAGRSGDRIAIGVFAYAIDDAGRIADHLSEGVVLEAEPVSGQISENGLRVFGRVLLPPGAFSLRVLVRMQGSARFFMARSRVMVPGDGTTRSTSLAAVFRDAGGEWLTIRQHGVPVGVGTGDGDPIVPAARPVLVEGRPTEFFMAGAGTVSSAVDARFVDSANRVVAEYPVEVQDARGSEASLRRAVLPAVDLPPGTYTLILETREEAEGSVGERQTLTVALAPAGGPYTWLDRSGALVVATPQTAARGDGAPSGFRRRKALQAYLEAVQALADGNEASAREQLMALERAANSNGQLRALRRLEDTAATDLAAADPKSLLPIALLHQQLVRRYAARNEFVLASFARSVAADRAAEIAASGADRAFAATILVNLAGDLARAASSAVAVSYLDMALAVDPSSRAALLAMGAIDERAADYGKAARVFERLVEAHPDFAEGRLRLAVNLARSGHERAAEREFRTLLDRQTSSWVDAVAAQEYVLMLLAERREDDVRVVLRSATEKLPDDQRLRVLAAYIADTSGQSLEAVDAILQIPPAEAGSSPRVRYSEWPDLGPEASATALRAAAAAALADLSTALHVVEGRQ